MKKLSFLLAATLFLSHSPVLCQEGTSLIISIRPDWPCQLFFGAQFFTMGPMIGLTILSFCRAYSTYRQQEDQTPAQLEEQDQGIRHRRALDELHRFDRNMLLLYTLYIIFKAGENYFCMHSVQG